MIQQVEYLIVKTKMYVTLQMEEENIIHVIYGLTQKQANWKKNACSIHIRPECGTRQKLFECKTNEKKIQIRAQGCIYPSYLITAKEEKAPFHEIRQKKKNLSPLALALAIPSILLGAFPHPFFRVRLAHFILHVA